MTTIESRIKTANKTKTKAWYLADHWKGHQDQDHDTVIGARTRTKTGTREWRDTEMTILVLESEETWPSMVARENHNLDWDQE